MYQHLLKLAVREAAKQMALSATKQVIKSLREGINHEEVAVKLVNEVADRHDLEKIDSVSDFNYSAMVKKVLSVLFSNLEVREYDDQSFPVMPWPEDEWFNEMTDNSEGLAAVIRYLSDSHQFATSFIRPKKGTEFVYPRYPLGYISPLGRARSNDVVKRQLLLLNSKLENESLQAKIPVNEFDMNSQLLVSQPMDNISTAVNVVRSIETTKKGVVKERYYLADDIKVREIRDKKADNTNNQSNYLFDFKLAPGLEVDNKQTVITSQGLRDILILTSLWTHINT